MNPRRHVLPLLLLLLSCVGFLTGFHFFNQPMPQKPTARPNFLLVITDDQSWIHTSYAGYPAVRTPNFDRLAQEGIYFDKAYVSAPTCTASRSAILTGQHFWRLGSAGQLWGEFPPALTTYQQILAEHGYKTGYTGKGWGPGKALLGNPAGPAYNRVRNNADPNFSTIDHVENFKLFLDERKPGQPFSFWISPTEPHRPFLTGIGASSGEIDMKAIQVPPFLPDTEAVRRDLADYLYEIQWFDRELGRILEVLNDRGELDNTVIVYTSDNGMPFPRAKSNNYEYGTRVPFAVRWGNGIPSAQRLADFVSLTDIAPTFLALAGIQAPQEMTGKSLELLITANRSGRIDKQRNAAYSGFQRHIGYARQDQRGYPSRAIHTDKFLYIRNFAPDRWPAGRPPELADIDDGSPSKNQLVLEREEYEDFWQLAAGKRPAEELYAISRDPGQVQNLADDPEYRAVKEALSRQLDEELQRTGDPAASGNTQVFDDYHYHSRGGD